MTRTALFLGLLVSFFAFLPQTHAASAKELFMDNCARCHGGDGKAHTPAGKKLGVKNLVESKFDTAEIAERIVHGFTDKNGNVKMPPFDGTLTKAEISDLASFVRSLRHKAG